MPAFAERCNDAHPPESRRTLYTREQAAEFFACSPRTVDAWTKAGHLRPTMFGRLVRYHRDELERVAREGIE